MTDEELEKAAIEAATQKVGHHVTFSNDAYLAFKKGIAFTSKTSDERIERLSNAVQLQAEQTKAILSILKTEWMARNNYDTFKYTPAEIEQMWTQFKRRFNL